MDALRTPDSRFEKLAGYPFASPAPMARRPPRAPT
jgi:hypothetical protein